MGGERLVFCRCLELLDILCSICGSLESSIIQRDLLIQYVNKIAGLCIVIGNAFSEADDQHRKQID